MTRMALATMALTLVTAGCNGSDSGEGSGGGEKAGAKAVTGSFVGNVDGTDAYVGIVVARDGDVFGYATDGVTNPDHLDGALGGRRDDSARLGNDGGAVLEAAFEGSTVTGTYTRPGYEPWTFTAERAKAPAGLYRDEQTFDDGLYVGGWIVLPDGTHRGAVRRYETPLAPGEVDATTFSPGDDTFTVPGGVLRPRRVTPSSDF